MLCSPRRLWASHAPIVIEPPPTLAIAKTRLSIRSSMICNAGTYIFLTILSVSVLDTRLGSLLTRPSPCFPWNIFLSKVSRPEISSAINQYLLENGRLSKITCILPFTGGHRCHICIVLKVASSSNQYGIDINGNIASGMYTGIPASAWGKSTYLGLSYLCLPEIFLASESIFKTWNFYDDWSVIMTPYHITDSYQIWQWERLTCLACLAPEVQDGCSFDERESVWS